LKNIIVLKMCHLETIHHTAFHSFVCFYLVNNIENFDVIHIKER